MKPVIFAILAFAGLILLISALAGCRSAGAPAQLNPVSAGAAPVSFVKHSAQTVAPPPAALYLPQFVYPVPTSELTNFQMQRSTDLVHWEFCDATNNGPYWVVRQDPTASCEFYRAVAERTP